MADWLLSVMSPLALVKVKKIIVLYIGEKSCGKVEISLPSIKTFPLLYQINEADKSGIMFVMLSAEFTDILEA